MGWDLSGSYFLAVIAFVAFAVGVAVGWGLATLRLKRTIQNAASRAGTGLAAGTHRAVRARTRTMEIQCACGSRLKFRDPVEPGYQPFPSGDSVTCPDCGRVKRLNQVRKLEEDAQA